MGIADFTHYLTLKSITQGEFENNFESSLFNLIYKLFADKNSGIQFAGPSQALKHGFVNPLFNNQESINKGLPTSSNSDRDYMKNKSDY